MIKDSGFSYHYCLSDLASLPCCCITHWNAAQRCSMLTGHRPRCCVPDPHGLVVNACQCRLRYICLKHTEFTPPLLKSTKSRKKVIRRHSILYHGMVRICARSTVGSTNPLTLSHTTTCLPSARTSLLPHFEYTTLRTLSLDRIVNRQRCRAGLLSQSTKDGFVARDAT